MVTKALYANNIFMLTHPGDKGPFDILELAKACEATDTLMEISNWHPHLDEEGIKTAAKTGVKFAISSDAHSPEKIGGFTKGLKRAQNAGLDLSRIVNIERI
jgi:putative hydrolase